MPMRSPRTVREMTAATFNRYHPYSREFADFESLDARQ